MGKGQILAWLTDPAVNTFGLTRTAHGTTICWHFPSAHDAAEFGCFASLNLSAIEPVVAGILRRQRRTIDTSVRWPFETGHPSFPKRPVLQLHPASRNA